jgi:hypothetical protein
MSMAKTAVSGSHLDETYVCPGPLVLGRGDLGVRGWNVTLREA